MTAERSDTDMNIRGGDGGVRDAANSVDWLGVRTNRACRISVAACVPSVPGWHALNAAANAFLTVPVGSGTSGWSQGAW